jgi:HD-GYP domain-containing protein (c-di-GMP phosphodiesterase class II)
MEKIKNNHQHLQSNILEKIKLLYQLGQSLNLNQGRGPLMETILTALQTLTKSDGGMLYTLSEDKKKLNFEVICNDFLGIKMGGKTQAPVDFSNIKLYTHEGFIDEDNYLIYSLMKNEILNIENMYSNRKWDFSKLRKFDRLTKYKTKAILVIPLKNQQEETLGLIQLINPRNHQKEIITYSLEDQWLAQFLGQFVSILFSHFNLAQELKKLFESIVQVLATAVDEKSAYTGGHCRRVAVIANLIAKSLGKIDYGPFKNFVFTPSDEYELELAALLHDCGKITTPVHIMDKSTKLETVFDRIDLIDTRFEVIIRDMKIKELENKIIDLEENPPQKKNHSLNSSCLKHKTLPLSEIYEDREFIRECNIGGEFLSQERKEKIQNIARKYTWKNPDDVEDDFLTLDEIKNLMISRGTLNPEEREIINHHAEMTLKMLGQMEFPTHLKRIPEYASCHHEKMNGEGYPRKLSGKDMSVQARVMAMADIFEALTAKDRPYKRGKTLSETLMLMGQMKVDNHIDPDIFDVFMDEKIYLHYAKNYLDDYQIDFIELKKIPGYIPKEDRLHDQGHHQKIRHIQPSLKKVA